MASTIIGNAIGASTTSKVLQRQNFNKEPNGLETIIESYAIKTVNRDVIVPARLTNYNSFSSSGKSYSRMVVESVATEEQDGGITQMTVTFVGLTSSTGLPPPIVRIIPSAGEGVYGPPIVVEAEYVTDVSEKQYMAGLRAQNNAVEIRAIWQTKIPMPSLINGFAMPQSPREPFHSSPEGGVGIIERYHGYVALSKSCEKRGLFLVARDTFHEFQEVAFIR